MFQPKTLIHLFVCLALILNGIGASVGMATAAVKRNAPVVEQVEKYAGPEAEAAAAMQSGCHEIDLTSSNSSEDASADCCTDGGCGCGCAHQSQVVLPAAFLVTPGIALASRHLERLATSLSPTLSRPVRPPIT